MGSSSTSESGTRPLDSVLNISSKTQQDVLLEIKECGNLSKNDEKVHRKLQQRHVSMMAIGGTIGTGLFLGIGNVLEKGGPLGLLLGYIIVGTVVYCLQMALGEMTTMFPISGSLTHFPSRFVDPALGFSVGWSYWYSAVICFPAEITAAAIVTEFFFSMVKIFAIVLLIILGLVLDLGGAPDHEMVGFKYWKNPGCFKAINGVPGSPGQFLSFCSVFVQVSYSFLGTETVAIAAGEVSNPRKAVPRAITSVFYRILVFYVFGALVVGMLVPSDEPRLLGGTGDATSSPFVIAINKAGIKILPDLINTFILVAAYSAASSQVYAGSRVLYGLANDRMAPKILKKCTKSGLPLAAIIPSVLPGFMAYMTLSEKSSKVFEWLVNLAAMGGLLTWWALCLSYIQFHKGLKAQGHDRNSLPFKAPGQPYLTYYAFFMFTLIILMNGFEVFLPGKWSSGDFLASYITIPLFIIFYIFWKIFKKTNLVDFRNLDLVTGQNEFQELNESEETNGKKSKSTGDRIMNMLF